MVGYLIKQVLVLVVFMSFFKDEVCLGIGLYLWCFWLLFYKGCTR